MPNNSTPSTTNRNQRDRSGYVRQTRDPARRKLNTQVLTALSVLLEAVEYREHCIKWQHIYTQPATQDDIRASRAFIAAYEARLDIEAATEVIAGAMRPDFTHPGTEMLELVRLQKRKRLGTETEAAPAIPVYRTKARKLASRNLPEPPAEQLTAT